MFHRDEELERVRTALAATGADMSAFRRWQKSYEKVNKQWPAVQSRYQDALLDTRQVEELAGHMEHMLIESRLLDRGAFAHILKELKRMQNTFDNEFLISREDVEFHSTYDTLLRLGTRALDSPAQRLILQSEVENLLDLLRENLAKPSPDPRKLSLFYQYGTDKELAVLPPDERLAKVERVYEARFARPIMELLSEAVQRADHMAVQLRGCDDRKSRKTFAAIHVLLETRGTPQERARGILEVLMI
jgi:hypothetical protein